jgi:hypothetical protein
MVQYNVFEAYLLCEKHFFGRTTVWVLAYDGALLYILCSLIH